MLKLSLNFQVYFVGQGKPCICSFRPATNPLIWPAYLVDGVFDPNWYEFWFL